LPAIRFGAGQSLPVLIGALLAFPLAALSAQDRIHGPIDRNRTVLLKGNLHSRVKPENDRGVLDPSVRIHQITLELRPTEEQAAALERFLEEQRNPSSPDYQRWLTPEEYGERFGASPNDVARLAAWLEAESLTVEQVARGRNWIAFSGTAAQVGAAFGTELRRYEADGEMHFANATEPSVPAVLAAVIGTVRGLDDFRLKPSRTRQIQPDFNASNGNHYLAPDDLATIYNIAPLYKAGFDGTGQKLAIVGQTAINLADMRGFRSTFGLPAKDPQLVLYGTNPGVSQGDQIEADLDLEWAGAVARNATIVYVYSQNVISSLQYAIDQNLAPVISMSYGGCESGNLASLRTIAQQANAQGITWMNASGDSGAAGCDYQVSVASHGPAVTFPVDVPEVTAVGGTEFAESGNTGWSGQNSATLSSATGYLPEKAWNDTALGGGIWASGGGASKAFPKPWWQAGPGVPNDGARDVPDISLTASGAHDGYVIYANGGLGAVGGTSASSPAFAGIVALINQYVVTKGAQAKPGLGNINPNLYNLAQTTTGIIHDITAGDNIVPCASGSSGCPSSGSFGYRAGVGYDLVTGLGSVDAYNLVTRWSSVPAGVGTTMTLAANPASMAATGTTTLTATITPVSGSNAPSGSVAFALGSTSLGTVAAVASGVTATATLTVKGSSLAAGANAITAAYTATGNFANSTATTTVTVTGPPVATTMTVAANPASIRATDTTQVTATVKPASGSAAPTGSVTFAVGSTVLGTASLAASAANAGATLAVKGSSLSIGSNTITATYTPTGSFTGSTATVSVTVTPPPVATTTAVLANPASISSTATTQLTATVKPASGTAAPTGSVTFAAGTTVLGTSPLTASGANGSATLAVKGSSLASGANTITATYVPAGNFGPSTGTVVVTLTTPPVATTMTAVANPASISSTATTQLTATVKPASGAAAPTGSVTFTLGGASLGTAALAASGGNSTATVTVKGSSLTAGSNTIAANYMPSGNFANSTASVTVTLTPPAAITTTTLAATPASIAATATTQLLATVKFAGGSAAPTGSVTFALGNLSLGTAPLSAAGAATATATLTVKGSSLAAGANTVTATYAGLNGANGSVGAATVTVIPAGASIVVATATVKTATSQGLPMSVQLQETGGVPTTVTGFTINGSSFTNAISAFFGTAQIPAKGTLTTNFTVMAPVPPSLVFVFTGADAGGRQWSQTLTVATR